MMTHAYSISGMTCANCQAKVEKLLSQVEGISQVKADWHSGEAEITMHRHIPTSTLQDALKHTNYQLSEKQQPLQHLPEEAHSSWLQTYKPILLLFAFITGISFLAQVNTVSFSWMLWMRHFMAGIFLAFSFFKLLNLQGFADSYSTYDILAKRWRPYAFIYAFIELGLGIAFLLNLAPLLVNSITVVVMGISLAGVLQSVLNKKKIRCACLGDVFNLPMSSVTILEDALMIVMALFTVLHLSL